MNKPLSVVRIGFLLSMGRVKRFEAKVVEMIKRRALAQARLGLQIKHSPFLMSVLGEREHENVEAAGWFQRCWRRVADARV